VEQVDVVNEAVKVVDTVVVVAVSEIVASGEILSLRFVW
jgi:hypothetical protein